MLKHILIATILTTVPVIAMDSEKHEQGSRHIIDYEELNKQKVPDEKITEIYHAEDERLSKIISGLGQAKAQLKTNMSEEAEDMKILQNLYDKYLGYQDDNSDRWSQGFTKRMEEERQ